MNYRAGEGILQSVRVSKIRDGILQDFNMVKIESRPQTNKNNTHKMLGKHCGKHEIDYSRVGRLAQSIIVETFL